MGLLGVGWDVAGVLLMLGRGGWNTWRGLGCSWRAFDAWAWYVGLLGVLECSWCACGWMLGGVFWNVAGVLMLGRGTWDYLA